MYTQDGSGWFLSYKHHKYTPLGILCHTADTDQEAIKLLYYVLYMRRRVRWLGVEWWFVGASIKIPKHDTHTKFW